MNVTNLPLNTTTRPPRGAAGRVQQGLGQDPVPLVQVSNVHRRFNLGETVVHALNGVSLDIRSGEFLSVWGPSGSGKSTLMNLLGLIDMPDQGEIRFDGKLTHAMDDDTLTDFRARRIGFVFQNFNLVPVLSALENIVLPLELSGESKGAARERAEQSLAEVGLARFAGSRPDQLSGGQRQRVAIARALVIRPQLVIADEPTANLDSENSRMVVNLMRELNQSHSVTFVFTTHDARLLDQVDRKILLRDGTIAEDEVLA